MADASRGNTPAAMNRPHDRLAARATLARGADAQHRAERDQEDQLGADLGIVQDDAGRPGRGQGQAGDAVTASCRRSSPG